MASYTPKQKEEMKIAFYEMYNKAKSKSDKYIIYSNKNIIKPL